MSLIVKFVVISALVNFSDNTLTNVFCDCWLKVSVAVITHEGTAVVGLHSNSIVFQYLVQIRSDQSRSKWQFFQFFCCHFYAVIKFSNFVLNISLSLLLFCAGEVVVLFHSFKGFRQVVFLGPFFFPSFSISFRLFACWPKGVVFSQYVSVSFASVDAINLSSVWHAYSSKSWCFLTMPNKMWRWWDHLWKCDVEYRAMYHIVVSLYFPPPPPWSLYCLWSCLMFLTVLSGISGWSDCDTCICSLEVLHHRQGWTDWAPVIPQTFNSKS